MPLAFDSSSHGTVAFGFFNIETDMLLLEELFFFADEFCRGVIECVVDEKSDVCIPGWRIAERTKIGDLHGAIAGVVHSGFIGATYQLYPFPTAPEDFKQNPEGGRTQGEIEELIASWGDAVDVSLSTSGIGALVSMGEYRFTSEEFAALVAYVERGGYPRWRDEVRPNYVTRMIERLSASGFRLPG